MEKQQHIQITIGELVRITVPHHMANRVHIDGDAPVKIQGQAEVTAGKAAEREARKNIQEKKLTENYENIKAAIEESVTFKQAAKKLNIKQPSMSGYLKRHPELRELLGSKVPPVSQITPEGGDVNLQPDAELQLVQKLIVCIAKHKGNLDQVSREMHVTKMRIKRLASNNKRLSEQLEFYSRKADA